MYFTFQNYPDHTKGMMLLGDINVNVQKDLISADKVSVKVIRMRERCDKIVRIITEIIKKI